VHLKAFNDLTNLKKLTFFGNQIDMDSFQNNEVNNSRVNIITQQPRERPIHNYCYDYFYDYYDYSSDDSDNYW